MCEQCSHMCTYTHCLASHNRSAECTFHAAVRCLPQAIADATSSGKGGAIAQVLAEAFSSGGSASASAEAVATAYNKDKRGVSEALASALATANSQGGKTEAAASAVAEVSLLNARIHLACLLRLLGRGMRAGQLQTNSRHRHAACMVSVLVRGLTLCVKALVCG